METGAFLACLIPESMMEPKVAGDRGLACVVISLIAISVVSRLDVRPRTAIDARLVSKAAETTRGAMLFGSLARQRGGRVVRELGRRIAGDYQAFHTRLNGLAAVQGFAVPTLANTRDLAAYRYLPSLEGQASFAELKEEADHGDSPEIRRHAPDNLTSISDIAAPPEDVDDQKP